MHFGEWGLWGMHVFWWLFWIMTLVVLLFPDTPVSRRRRSETPLDLLQRRYAKGEIDTAEYEERKVKLEQDTKLDKH